MPSVSVPSGLVQVHDLGSFWVESDGVPMPLNGQRMAAALAALVLNLGEKVRTDVLIDSVWGATPSPRAPAALDTLMWRMRRVLDPARPARASSTVLRTVEQGYRLTIPSESVDSCQFDAAARALAAQAPLDPTETLDLSAAALALWRGRPYDDIDDDGWLEARRSHLLEQHLTIQQARITALLDVGQPEQAVAELVPVLAGHPFVERLWCLRLLGLYQSGRINAASEAYADVERLLDVELSVSPGPELQALHEQILRRDPSLSGRPLAHASHAVVRIPSHRTLLVGRVADVDAVDDLLNRHRLVSVIGPVGCGKTRLAAAIATQIQARFADGVYFVDLSDVASDNDVADRVQESLRVEGGGSGDATHDVAAFVAGREILIVLDNCEQVVGSVRALIGSMLDHDGPQRILVTSRRVIGDDDERVFSLRPLDLPSSTDSRDVRESPAVALFVDRVARHGMTIDLDGSQGAEVARICEAVDGLPLGIELAAARAQVFELHEITAIIADQPMSLGSPTDSRQRTSSVTLRESIGWSYDGLTDQEKLTHRRLSVLPTRFTLEAAVAACASADLHVDDVPAALIGLVGQSLLEATKPERANGSSLFRQLVPIRAHAAEQLQLNLEAGSALDAILRWIMAVLATAPRMGQVDGGRLDGWLEDNRRTITAALEAGIARGPSDEIVVALCRLVPFWWLEGKLSPETVRLASAAANAVGPDNSDFATAAAIAAHRSFLALTGQATPSTTADLGAALHRLRTAPPELEIFAAEMLVALAAACWVGGDIAAARGAADGAADYGERLDDAHIRVLAKAVRCAISLMDDPAAARETAHRVLTECEELDNPTAAIMCCHTLYMAALFDGDGPDGLRWNEQAIRLQQEIGQRNAATTLEARGSLYQLAGRPRDAIRCYGSAHFQYARGARSWQIPGSDELMAAARSQLTPDEFDQAWASGERLAASDVVGAWI